MKHTPVRPSPAPSGGARASERPLCEHPECTRRVKRAAQGRPRKYCSDACRNASRRAGRKAGRAARVPGTAPDTSARDDYPREISVDIRNRGTVLLRLASRGEEGILPMLREAQQLTQDADDLKAALVQQARDRRMPMREVAAALHISSDTVRRHWRPGRIDERMRDRRRRNRQGRRGPGGGRPVRGGGRWPDADQPNTLATARFARALSHLQRVGGRPLRVVGEEAGVSASYVSRALSGERLPSWPVARRLVLACSGDPAELLPLWEAARGRDRTVPRTPPDAGALHAALRGLHLAAARPDPAAVCRSASGRLTPPDIDLLLHGTEDGSVPDWSLVEHFIRALHGSPEDVRPLWDAVRRNAGTAAASPGPATGAPGRSAS